MKYTILFIFLVGIFSCNRINNTVEKTPNILLIVTDDQAYGDLSHTGNSLLETPTLDQLAQSGVFANHFYVSPVCAPTRASLLTGRYHQKTGVSGVTRGREDMQLDEETMADIFKSFGYRTGIFGKWHNGAHYPYHPLGRGFDEFVGFTSGHWSNYFNTKIEKNGADFQTEGYLTDVLTNEAIKFIEDCSSAEKAFFCYLPYQTPHTPLQVPDRYFNKYKQKGVDDFNACIYGMCENIDDNVQRLLEKLDQLEEKENTIVIFLSDNGPLNNRFNNGLKGRKGMLDEGGVRVPFILNWPKINDHGKEIEASLAHIDLLPTILELIGKDYEFKNKIDGESFAKLITSNSEMKKRKIFGEWSGKSRVLSDPYLMVGEALYDIRKDPNQEVNIREQNREIYQQLKDDYQKWYGELQLNQIENKAIPIGYKEYPKSVLPAHEANLYPPYEFRKDRRHTGIAYHSLYGWAHDWIDFWTSEDAYPQWKVEVVTKAQYAIELQYALEPENVGVEISIQIGDQIINKKINQAYIHKQYPNYDRVERSQEAPETNWGTLQLGTLELQQGIKVVKVRSVKIPGNKSIELKSLKLIRQL
jgi:arylsulfatase A-like enzyme